MIIQHNGIDLNREVMEKLLQLCHSWEEEATRLTGYPVRISPIVFDSAIQPDMYQDMVIAAVKNIVCAKYKINQEDLESKSRKREYSDSRFICYKIIMWACKKLKREISLKRVGQNFGGRDHSTVINGLERYEDLYETDPIFRQDADDLLNQFLRLMNEDGPFISPQVILQE